jgi:hypothetical protein
LDGGPCYNTVHDDSTWYILTKRTQDEKINIKNIASLFLLLLQLEFLFFNSDMYYKLTNLVRIIPLLSEGDVNILHIVLIRRPHVIIISVCWIYVALIRKEDD